MAELKVADSTWQLGWPLGVTVRLAYEEIVTVLADMGESGTNVTTPTNNHHIFSCSEQIILALVSVGWICKGELMVGGC